MESGLSTTLPTTSSSESNHSTPQFRAIYATERAKILFGGYRRGDANDPDMYVASIAAVLALYEPEIIAQVTDPRTGISTHEKFRTFMPNSGELKAYCDEHQAIRDRRQRYAALPRPSFDRQPRLDGPKGPGHLANVFVPSSAPGYQAMRDWASTADTRYWRNDEGGRAGIWVALHLYQERKERQDLHGFRQFTAAELLTLYGREPAPKAAE